MSPPPDGPAAGDLPPADDGAGAPLHVRSIRCQGRLRPDGLIEMEASLQDETGVATDLIFKRLEAGDLIHDMGLRVVLDADLVIVDVSAATRSVPAPTCPEAAAAYARLRGLRIGPGFKRAVRERVGGAIGCTHLTELAGVLASTAQQTLFALRRRAGVAPPDRRYLVDSCHTYREGGLAWEALQLHDLRLKG